MYPKMRLFVDDGMDAQLIYSALERDLEKYEHDRRTKYDGDPRFCQEDVVFLDDAISRVHLLMHFLKDAHRAIVTKG